MFVSVASGRSLLLVSAALLAIASAGIQHNVGDKVGWKLPSLAKINYTDWASQYSFQVQDTLHFRYDPGAESVLQVTRADYVSCSNSTPLAAYDDGGTVIYLLRDGTYWFVSGNPTHCNAGQKFSIFVEPLRHRSYPSAAEPSPTSSAAQGIYRRVDPVAVPLPPPSSSARVAAASIFSALVCIVSVVIVA